MLALGDPGLYKHLAGTLQGSLQFFPRFFLIDVLFFHHQIHPDTWTKWTLRISQSKVKITGHLLQVSQDTPRQFLVA